MQFSIKQVLDLALQHHSENRLRDAGKAYRQILQRHPNHPVALHLLGVVSHQIGKDETAIKLIKRALSIKPNYPETYNSLGNVYKDRGDLEEAIPYYQKAIALFPKFAEAHSNLSSIYYSQGKFDEAIASCRKAIAIDPNDAKSHTTLGNAQKESGNLHEAIACYRKAIEMKPDYLNAHNNLGNTLAAIGELESSIDSFETAISIKPDHADVYKNMGDAYQRFGKLEEAVACYKKALQIAPGFSDVDCKLGNVYAETTDSENAISSYQNAIVSNPVSSDAHNNLGLVYTKLGKFDEALLNYEKARSIAPDLPELHNNLGTALKGGGRLDKALSSFRQAITLKPDFTDAHSNLLLAEHYRPGHDMESLFKLHRHWEETHAQRYYASWPSHDNVRDPKSRMRIGFVSPDLGHHPVGFFARPLLDNLPKQEIESIVYSDRMDDKITIEIRAIVDTWNDTRGLPDDILAQKILNDQIDILFDLSGHTAGNRMLLFARKPAPIQISWAGYVGTTGLSAIDYVLSDRYSTLENEERYYSETIIRMPDGWLCYAPPDTAPDCGPPPFERNQYITFGSFNNPAKINDDVITAWSKILAKTPKSRLLIKYTGVDSTLCREYLEPTFAAEGIALSRLILEDGSPHDLLLSRYNDVDIALDPFPYSGGLTTYEALWMGVPVVTFPGQTFASRHSLSHLSTLGLSELAGNDETHYVNIAVALANDPDRLKEIQSGLRQKMAASPVCDGKLFAQNFTALMRQVWETWCWESNNAQTSV